jgi:hypothetical protein
MDIQGALKMKKTLICLVVVFLTARVLSAQDAGTFGFGVKGGLNIGFSEESGTMKQIMADEGYGYDVKTKMGGLMGVHFSYTFLKNLSIQPEINFMINQGLKYTIKSGGSGEMKVDYSSTDFVAALKYSFLNVSRVRFGVVAGPLLAVPMGCFMEAEGPGGNSRVEIETSGVTFGITGGIFASYAANIINIFMDVRYLRDFNFARDGVEDEMLRRQGIVISLGVNYEF